jgi:LL-diaminopimelate aminotransferase
MRPSKRLERIPPYLFAELERKIAAKRAAGVDVISLGIGDPDTPTYGADRRGDAARRSPSRRRTATRPTAAARTSARPCATSTSAASVVTLDPEPRSCRRSAPRSASSTSTSRSSTPGDVRARGRPRLPGLHGRPVAGRRRAGADAARARARLRPGPRAIDAETLEARALMFLNYPNNPTGAIVPDGFFERGRRVRARHDILVVHDNAYRRPPTTATSRRRSWPRRAPRTSASRSSRCPRATT